MSHKAIFLDADGVLNQPIIREDGKPIAPLCVEEFHIYPETYLALQQLKNAGYTLICVTNKPDVADGRMTQENLDAIFTKMRAELPLDDIFACYERDSECYKPKPKLLLDAAKKYSLDICSSYMIGDTPHDIGAGQNAGCKTIFIDRQYPNAVPPTPPADYTVDGLSEAVEMILKSV